MTRWPSNKFFFWIQPSILLSTFRADFYPNSWSYFLMGLLYVNELYLSQNFNFSPFENLLGSFLCCFSLSMLKRLICFYHAKFCNSKMEVSKVGGGGRRLQTTTYKKVSTSNDQKLWLLFLSILFHNDFIGESSSSWL